MKTNTYIALFRGINIGGHHTLPMKDLVRILQEMGFENIKTYIQSGNVVFQSTKTQRNSIAKDISQKISDIYGFEPKVLLLDQATLQDAIKNNPFETSDGKALHIIFLESIPTAPDLERLNALKSKSEEFKLSKNIFYLFTPEGVGRSKLAANIEKSLGVEGTGRNWNTVSKLIAMVKEV